MATDDDYSRPFGVWVCGVPKHQLDRGLAKASQPLTAADD